MHILICVVNNSDSTGIAINKDGIIYFADGANIRMIDDTGIIRTLIGSQGHPKYWQPLPCHRVVSIEEVPKWLECYIALLIQIHFMYLNSLQSKKK